LILLRLTKNKRPERSLSYAYGKIKKDTIHV